MINSTTLFLLNLAIRTPCRSLLDLGTGCGVVAIVAASQFAEQVTATDLSGRAGLFARFNAWLNESPNVEVLTGDLFQPVAGRRFERILSNPPFYVTPSSAGFSRRIPWDWTGFAGISSSRLPAHLEEGGFLQMLCEWPEIEGQPWEERLSEWFEGTGCDAVVCAGGTYDPILYAQNRLPVVTTPAGKEADYQKFEEWVSYYKAEKVKAIHAGFLTMRRRSGQNWVHFERVSTQPYVPLGDAMLHLFAEPRSAFFRRATSGEQAAGRAMEFSCGRSWISATASGGGLRRVRWCRPRACNWCTRSRPMWPSLSPSWTEARPSVNWWTVWLGRLRFLARKCRRSAYPWSGNGSTAVSCVQSRN